jgi:hypothetical protein
MVYGSALPRLFYTYSGFVNGDFAGRSLTGAPGIATSVTQSSSCGSYAITMHTGSLAAANYAFSFVSGELTIGKAALTIVPATAAMTYGGTLPAFGYSLQGFVNGDGANVVSGAPAFSTSASRASAAGTYRITAAQGTLNAANYSFTAGAGQIAIGKAMLTIVPVAASMTYGGALPNLGYTLKGFVNGDGAGAVSGAPALLTTASKSSPSGAYSVTATQGTLSSANYSFTAVPGQVVVGKAMLTIAPAAASMTYGGALPKLGYTLQGFVNGDKANVVAGAPVLTTTALASSAVGTYRITVTQGTLTSANYSFTAVPGQIAIGKAMLTIAVSPASMTYGDAVPKFAFTMQGLVNGDTMQKIGGAPVYATSASASSQAGTYPVSMTQGSLASANYTFQFVSGSIVVNKAVLTIKPDNATMTYGGQVPSFTWTTTGFVNGDSASSVTGRPVITTAASSASPVGSYPVALCGGTITAANY